MPKQRVLTPEQEAIIGRGGEPGASAVVAPIRQGKADTVRRKEAPSARSSIDGACRPTMVRIPLEEYAELKNEIQNRSKSEKVSMNSWIVAAIRQRLDRGE